MAHLDWPGLLQTGLQHLRLKPEEFWRLTPIELKLMLGAEGPRAGLSRARLEELTAAFPDKKGAAIHDGHTPD